VQCVQVLALVLVDAPDLRQKLSGSIVIPSALYERGQGGLVRLFDRAPGTPERWVWAKGSSFLNSSALGDPALADLLRNQRRKPRVEAPSSAWA
jgi:hypothetical protein